MKNDTDKANFRCTADKIVYFVSSADRRILIQERVAKRAEVPRVTSALFGLTSAVKYVPHVKRTIFFDCCIPKISRVGVVSRAEN